MNSVPAAHQHARNEARPKVISRLMQSPLHLRHVPQVRPHLPQLLRRRRQLCRFRLEPRVVLGHPQLVPAIMNQNHELMPYSICKKKYGPDVAERLFESRQHFGEGTARLQLLRRLFFLDEGTEQGVFPDHSVPR